MIDFDQKTLKIVKFMIDFDGVEDCNLCGFFLEADFPDETRGVEPLLRVWFINS